MILYIGEQVEVDVLSKFYYDSILYFKTLMSSLKNLGLNPCKQVKSYLT